MPDAAWHFPPRSGGQTYLDDPIAAHFADAPLDKMVREVIQNSLDAGNAAEMPHVEVAFCQTAVNRAWIDADGLAAHLETAYQRAQTGGKEKIRRAYRRGLDILQRETLPCLAIIDCGTTGLTERKWDYLVETDGGVAKDAPGAGGSFGMGKNSVFNVSAVNAVIYATRYTAKRKGLIQKMTGKASLITHADPANEGIDLQHIGFFRDADGQPLTNTRIPDPFRLSRTGTGVFILGFQPRRDDWTSSVIRGVIHNFFVAIHERRLRVSVEDAEGSTRWITHETLAQHFKDLRSTRKINGLSVPVVSDREHYYLAFRGEQGEPYQARTEPVAWLGRLEVYVNAHAHAPRRIAYVNRKGMFITDAGLGHGNPLSATSAQWPDYAAVVRTDADDGDRWIRTMEDVSHERINPAWLDEAEQVDAARATFREGRDRVKAAISQFLLGDEQTDAENMREMRALFPDDLGAGARKAHTYVSPIRKPPAPIPPQTPQPEEVEPTPDENGDAPSPHNGHASGVPSEPRRRHAWRRGRGKIPALQGKRIMRGAGMDATEAIIAFTPTLPKNATQAVLDVGLIIVGEERQPVDASDRVPIVDLPPPPPWAR